MRGLMCILLLVVTASTAMAEQLWLVVAASDTSPAGIAVKAKRFGDRGLIIQTKDCGERRNMFAWAVDLALSAESATAALNSTSAKVPDAYLKKCKVQEGSLLSFRQGVVDMSIADIPQDAVNWADRDRISEVRPLKNGTHIIIARSYQRNKEDPLEGRRERLILVDRQKKKIDLGENCIDPGAFVASGGVLAVQCVREQAGDELLHSIVIFNSRGEKVREINHCRTPRLTLSAITCDSESVGYDGVLRLQPRTEHLK